MTADETLAAFSDLLEEHLERYYGEEGLRILDDFAVDAEDDARLTAMAMRLGYEAGFLCEVLCLFARLYPDAILPDPTKGDLN